MATKPTIADARWATDGAAELTAPSSGQRDSGFVGGTAAVADYANVLHKEAYKWAQYVDEGILTGAFALASAVSPAAIGGATDNYNPTGLSGAVVIRQDLSALTTLTGLTGGAAGRLIVLVNIDPSFDLFLTHDATSTAANRFTLPGSVGYRLRPGQTAILRYDDTSARWRLIGGTGTSKKTLVVGGGALQQRADGVLFTLGSDSNYQQQDGNDTILPLDFPVGTYIESVVAKATTSATAGTRGVQLTKKSWDDTGTEDVVASDTDTTTGSLVTITLASTLPYEVESNKKLQLVVDGVTNDVWHAFKVEFYP